MAITLSKGSNLSLSKADPKLNKLIIGLGWESRSTDGADFDLDASAFMVKEDGKVRSNSDFIFYNQLRTPCGSVEHTGDNRTGEGEGEGDDESILVSLDKIPTDIISIFITVTIHDAEIRKQNFGQVSQAFVRIINKDSGVEVVRYDLSEDASTETAMIFCQIYKHNNEWKFKAIGQGYAGGLEALTRQYGITV
jgi:tellurium resistance protein TerD